MLKLRDFYLFFRMLRWLILFLLVAMASALPGLHAESGPGAVRGWGGERGGWGGGGWGGERGGYGSGGWGGEGMGGVW